MATSSHPTRPALRERFLSIFGFVPKMSIPYVLYWVNATSEDYYFDHIGSYSVPRAATMDDIRQQAGSHANRPRPDPTNIYEYLLSPVRPIDIEGRAIPGLHPDLVNTRHDFQTSDLRLPLTGTVEEVFLTPEFHLLIFARRPESATNRDSIDSDFDPMVLVEDIGVFDVEHAGKDGSHWLRCRDRRRPVEGEVVGLVRGMGGQPQASFRLVESVCGMGKKEMTAVRDYMEKEYHMHCTAAGDEDEDAAGLASTLMDFKLSLCMNQLAVLVGGDVCGSLLSVFGGRVDEVVLRRSSAIGQHINFHLDVSERTMQVCLNERGDAEYVGGRIVYCVGDGLCAPVRVAGSAVVHSNDVVHGVSELEAGVRYGLFFLQKKKNKKVVEVVEDKDVNRILTV